jgi:hypothetical protein
MVAGRTHGGVLSACDQMFPDDAALEERPVDNIPRSERCLGCQGVHAAAERNRVNGA